MRLDGGVRLAVNDEMIGGIIIGQAFEPIDLTKHGHPKQAYGRGNNTMQMYLEADVDTSCLADQQVTILGYGSQGRAHALNLRDSGFNVVVGLRPDGSSWARWHEPADGVRECGGRRNRHTRAHRRARSARYPGVLGESKPDRGRRVRGRLLERR